MAVIPFAGVLVDRYSRRLVIASVDAIQAIATLVLIILFMLNIHEIWQILIILMIRGVCQGFHDPAVQAIIPIMVPRSKLKTINSLEYFSNGLVNLIGPIIGAGLIGLFGIENLGRILFIDIVTFLIAFSTLLVVSIPSVRVKNKSKTDRFSEEFKLGLNYIKERSGLLSLLSAFTSSNFFMTPIFVLLPLIIISPFLINGDQNLLGIAMFFQALGTIIGSLIMSKFKLFKNNSKGVFIGLLIMYLSTGTMIGGALYQSFPILALGIFVVGLSLPLANVSSQVIWQTAVPLQLHGRVYSVRRFIAQFLGPVAMFLAGIFGDLIGLVTLVVFSTGIGLFILLYLWYFGSLSTVEININEFNKITQPEISITKTINEIPNETTP
jgi:MFS transporter, DHA3 family, macrolide efflux protein